jgi:hypothetical protein
MGRRKQAKRQHKIIGFKAHTDTDADLLAWWESIPSGQHSDALRALMRMALGGLPLQVSQSPQLDYGSLQTDLAWMRDALSELPGYVERVLQTNVIVHHSPVPAPHHEADEQSVRRREERMRRKQW